TEYFNNISLSGSPKFTTCETGISHDWGRSGGPGNGVGTDNFSVRWTGTFNFIAGTYTFAGTADDGIRAWLDSVPIINGWVDQGATTYTATANVASGTHTVVVEFYDHAFEALAQFDWSAATSSAGTLQFSAPAFSVGESAGSATITITRTGGSVGA